MPPLSTHLRTIHLQASLKHVLFSNSGVVVCLLMNILCVCWDKCVLLLACGHYRNKGPAGILTNSGILMINDAKT